MIGLDAVVLVAMGEEAGPFLARADSVGSATSVGAAEHRLLGVGGHAVLLVQCGIGLVNAAAATALALAQASPRLVVSAGSSGGLRDVHVGDVVVASACTYAQADARAFGYELGQVPGMPARFVADEALLAAAAVLDVPGVPLRTGLVVSGDTFVDATLVEGVREAFPLAVSTDMESTAVAHVGHLSGVPTLSVRGISDLCGPTAGQDHTQRVDDAADRSAATVYALLTALG